MPEGVDAMFGSIVIGALAGGAIGSSLSYPINKYLSPAGFVVGAAIGSWALPVFMFTSYSWFKEQESKRRYGQ